MSENLKDKSCLVHGDGQFVELAIRLARDFGKVYYHAQRQEGFVKVEEAAVGNGFEEIEWVKDLWPHKDKIDLFVFCDILSAADQLELMSQGKRVIGSRNAETLETDRLFFKKSMSRLGVAVPKWIVCEGLTALQKHLQKVDDKWVKLNACYRGTFETRHHCNYELSKGWLSELEFKLGPIAEELIFLVEDPVKGKVELGYDGFCFAGQFPSRTLFGPEVKSRSYIGKAVEYEDLDERLLDVNSALAALLEQFGSCNFLSTEVRFAEGDDNFEDGTPVILEPTCRIPSPPFESELEMYGNLSWMLWHGSEGQAITPEMEDKYTVTCRILHEDDSDKWRSLAIPDKVRRWVKLYDPCKQNGLFHIAPKSGHGKRMGAVVGNGSSILKAIEACKTVLDALTDQPITSEFDSLADALKELKTANSEGIEIGSGTIPEPSIVVEA